MWGAEHAPGMPHVRAHHGGSFTRLATSLERACRRRDELRPSTAEGPWRCASAKPVSHEISPSDPDFTEFASNGRLGRIGIWSNELRFGDAGACAEAAAELEELGYGAIWVPSATRDGLLEDVAVLLGATRRVTVATGILNIWKHDPSDVGAWWRDLNGDHQARTMLGLGVSHALVVGADYSRPVATMSAYLDQLDLASVPSNRRCLAALGPKMLDLARDRSVGAHPYLVTPEHTAVARERLGPGALLAPEQGVNFGNRPGKGP